MYNLIKDNSSSAKLPLEQDAWILFKFPNLELIRLHLEPGSSMENHTNDWRIVFHVLRGEGTLVVEESKLTLGEQQSIAVEAGKRRFWSNPGNQDLELLVIKTPAET
jgi:quercetin dioxygenase-like cupin family protein